MILQQDFETMLHKDQEEPTLDYKESCDWSPKTFLKDILAMSNVQDGGYIIIGVAEIDGNFERIGVKDYHKKTYQEIDIMRDQIKPYADPHVIFDAYFKKKDGKEYVIIHVRPFSETPVISKKTLEDVKEGMLYYRTSSGRAASVPVSNSHDLRNILDRAALIRMRQMMKMANPIASDLPIIKSDVIEKLNAELNGL